MQKLRTTSILNPKGTPEGGPSEGVPRRGPSEGDRPFLQFAAFEGIKNHK